MKHLLLAILFVFFTLPHAFAQKEAKAGAISDVAFIEGSWKAVAGDRTIEAVWSPGEGESIVGFVRVTKEDKIVLYELFAFEQTEQGLVALVRHFGPGLTAWEEKENPNRYRFLQSADGRALFEKEGEATRVRYEKRSDNEFAIVIGKEEGGSWSFKDFWVFKRSDKKY